MKIILKLALIVFLFGCKSSVKEEAVNSKSVSVSIADFESEKFHLSRIIDNVELIVLQTSKESLISNIDKIVEFDKGFLIFDRPGTNKIFQFDKAGNFVNAIGTTGFGPDELVRATDFYYDPRTAILYILDNAGELTIKKFELSSGKYLGKLSLKNSFGDRFIKLANNNWAISGVYNQEPIGFFITDSTLSKVIYNDVAVHPYSMAFGIPNAFSKSADNVLFRVGEESTIYKVSENDNKLEPFLYIDFEKKATKEMYEKEAIKLKGRNLMQLPQKLENSMHYIFHFVDNSRYTFLDFFYQNKLHYLFLNKSNQHKFVIPAAYLEEDVSGQGKDSFTIMGNALDGTSMISFLSPSDLGRLKEGGVPAGKIGLAVYNKLRSLSVESNPVIIKYKLKDF
jgi:hypothetical protein